MFNAERKTMLVVHFSTLANALTAATKCSSNSNDRRVLKKFNTEWLDMLFEYVRGERGPGEAFLFRGFAVLGFLSRLLYYGVRSAARADAERRYKLAETAAFLRFSLGLGPRTDPWTGETL